MYISRVLSLAFTPLPPHASDLPRMNFLPIHTMHKISFSVSHRLTNNLARPFTPEPPRQPSHTITDSPAKHAAAELS